LRCADGDPRCPLTAGRPCDAGQHRGGLGAPQRAGRQGRGCVSQAPRAPRGGGTLYLLFVGQRTSGSEKATLCCCPAPRAGKHRSPKKGSESRHLERVGSGMSARWWWHRWPHALCRTATKELRIVTVGISGGRSLTRRFATPADFPLHDCSPYSHVHVRREGLGFVHRSRAISCRSVPKPKCPRFATCSSL
jgi:hypothetical protein